MRRTNTSMMTAKNKARTAATRRGECHIIAPRLQAGDAKTSLNVDIGGGGCQLRYATAVHKDQTECLNVTAETCAALVESGATYDSGAAKIQRDRCGGFLALDQHDGG